MFTTNKYPNKRFSSVEELKDFSKKREETLKRIERLKKLIGKIKVFSIKKIYPP